MLALAPRPFQWLEYVPLPQSHLELLNRAIKLFVPQETERLCNLNFARTVWVVDAELLQHPIVPRYPPPAVDLWCNEPRRHDDRGHRAPLPRLQLITERVTRRE